jgi:hypothetical protein
MIRGLMIICKKRVSAGGNVLFIRAINALKVYGRRTSSVYQCQAGKWLAVMNHHQIGRQRVAIAASDYRRSQRMRVKKAPRQIFHSPDIYHFYAIDSLGI